MALEGRPQRRGRAVSAMPLNARALLTERGGAV
jgi:hypothetical protein